jgi:polyisoprenoid-binding protein YceI
MRRFALVACVSIATLSLACDEKKKEEPTSPAPAASVSSTSVLAPASAPSGSSGKSAIPEPPAGATRFLIVSGKGSFLIDAPLEKIKGMTDETRGYVDANPKELAKTRGELMVRVSTLKTSTFGNMDKDAAQTEHARNWMEVGADSAPESRMKYEWATLAITSIDATPAALAEASEVKGARVVKAKVSGDFTIHGITSKKTVPVTVSFQGPPDAPTVLLIKTEEPMAVSMKEHDIRPRDKVGSFLSGALERIGKKIDDTVQVSFEATAKPSMPAHP